MTDERKNILALGAHAADQELAAGMLLAKYAKAGHRVTILSLTAGEKGHPSLDSAAYRCQKVLEARACAEKLGVETQVLDYKDAELRVDEEVTYVVCDLIREMKPSVLITHWDRSMHKDHRNAHRIALDARFYAGLRRIERDFPSHWVDRVLYSENWEDMEGFEPDLYVDTTDEFEGYCDALACFELWEGGTGWPYSDYYKSLARMRACVGFGNRAKYATALARPPEARVVRVAELP